MLFKKKSFKRSYIGKRKVSKNKKKISRQNEYSGIIKKILGIFLIFFLILFCIGTIIGREWFNKNILEKLPPISNIENIHFAQTTIIQDRNGKTLYKLFEENRKYVEYDKISQNMINALIAIEDKNFWTNPGFDIRGIIRAFIHDISNRSLKHGGSTITQQLIKNLLLTSDKKIERKLKELVLSVKINSYIKDQINSKYKGLSQSDIDKKSKEKILELYLNYIPFGNNTFGIETASQLYFGTSAQNLDILQSSILASIPKSATIYNPYTKRENVIGSLLIENIDGESEGLTGNIKELIINEIKTKIESSTITFMNDERKILDYIKGLMNFKYKKDGITYQVKYNQGRKDDVLVRMYDSKFITQKEFKENFIKGLNIELNKSKIDIKAPHFVFWIIELMEKQYGEDLIRKGGLTIKTSLDLNIQNFAEESMKNNKESLIKDGANNSAMIYTDSQNGDILAYVGSIDYYDEKIDGKVDIIQRLRQPGSAIKPLIYAQGFMNNDFTLDTPIFDINMKIGGNSPQNVDGKFLGLMTLKEALGYSRNIPAIKMYFINGQENTILDFLEAIGIKSLKENQPKGGYGYPLSIGAGELKLIELTNAYMHLSALGKPAKINPILEIRNSDDSIIYRKNIEYQKQIISSSVGYLIRSILSDKKNFPVGWRATYTYPGFPVANKSGTSNINKNGVKLPRDGLLANYTPSKVALFWVGNTRGEPMKSGSFGGWLNSPIWKEFFDKLEKNGYLKEEEMEKKEIKNLSITETSGKLPNSLTPSALIKNTIGSIDNSPIDIDESIQKIEIDSLCHGKVSQYTPANAIIEGYLINPTSIMKDGRDLEEVTKRWGSTGTKIYSEKLGKKIFFEAPGEVCKQREIIATQGKIKIELLKPTSGSSITRNVSIWYKASSPFNIKEIKIYINNIKRGGFEYNQKEINENQVLNLSTRIGKGKNILKVIAIDEYGYEDSQEISINIIDEDINPPYLINDKTTIIDNNDGTYNISLTFKDDESFISSGKIMQNEIVIHNFSSQTTTFSINNKENLKYEISDYYGNTKKDSINF